MPGMNAMPPIRFFVRGFLISRSALAAENLALSLFGRPCGGRAASS
jgi:hypothetical protein